jgi:TPR repeat protein
VNTTEAVRLYKLALNSDPHDPRAAYALSLIYHFGEGVVRANPPLAAEWAMISAGKGDFLGLIRYAFLLQEGIGVAKDPVKAQELLDRAHSAQFAAQQNDHGYDLEIGKGCTVDREGAFRYYGLSANNGNVYGMYNLAKCFDRGIGTVPNAFEATQWYKRAAEKNFDKAIYAYGMALAAGKGVPKDPARAIDYLMRAGDVGLVQAYLQVGDILDRGDGVAKDLARAFACYMKAAEKGNPGGMGRVGLFFELGRGVPANINEAVKWYQWAVERKDVLAMERLAYMYKDGRGVPRNPGEAKRLFKMAIDAGNHALIAVMNSF